MTTVLHAVLGYIFLLFVVRFTGRRPGAQMTPFEFVLIFFIGGLVIQSVVGEDHSFTTALTAISTVALLHALVSWLKQKYPRVSLVLDGTPLVLYSEGEWRDTTMYRMRIQRTDVMEAARVRGIEKESGIKTAILERNGGISIIARN